MGLQEVAYILSVVLSDRSLLMVCVTLCVSFEELHVNIRTELELPR